MFYCYTQNNSGGSFDVNHRVAHYVIIEADSAQEADQIAEDRAGIYFNGCADGLDCDCCGDRWYSAWGKGDDVPMIYDLQAERYVDMWAADGEPYCHIYYKDGLCRTLRANKTQEQKALEG